MPARALFCGLDLFYGRRRTLEKFRVLELIARVPYQAWEQRSTSPPRTSTGGAPWRAASTTASSRPARSRTTSCGTSSSSTRSSPPGAIGETRFRGSVDAAMKAALGCLDARERYIVETRMLADADEELSFAQIGRRFGISRERARQLEVRAKSKLRGRVAAHGDPTVVEWMTTPSR
jgi:DNA-directed RNA polymerase specialized sigma24 family protein